jgi:hypothetical protein
MLNRLPLNAAPLNAAGNVDLSIRYTSAMSGAAVQYRAFTAVNTGEHGLGVLRYAAHASGAGALYKAFGADLAGHFGLGAFTYGITLSGAATHYGQFVESASGAAAHYRNVNTVLALGGYGISRAIYTISSAGAFSQGLNRYAADSAGGCALAGFNRYNTDILGYHAQLAAYRCSVQGLQRIANDALGRYELFIGVDAAPDFATPAATFADLPHDTDPLTPGHVYQFVLRRRNRYNLSSRNVSAWTLDLSAGAIANASPPAPPSFSAAVTAGGTVTISGQYAYASDLANQADEWLLYFTTTGIDPDPNTATPLTGIMRKADGIARFSYTTSALAASTNVRVLLRVRRNGTPDVDSTNTLAIAVTVTTDGPPAPVGDVLFGKVAAQA